MYRNLVRSYFHLLQPLTNTSAQKPLMDMVESLVFRKIEWTRYSVWFVGHVHVLQFVHCNAIDDCTKMLGK